MFFARRTSEFTPNPLPYRMGSICFVFVFSTITGCFNKEKKGIQDAYVGYVTARTAVFPCKAWEVPFAGKGLTNAPADEIKDLCKSVDTFVIEGFKNQPYMKGFSFQTVQRLLEKAGQSQLLEIKENILSRPDKPCYNCRSLQDFYKKTLFPNPVWRDWLKSIRDHTAFADTVLLPFIVHLHSSSYLDKGGVQFQRSGEVALLLIETDTAEIVWTQSRSTFVRNEVLLEDKTINVNTEQKFPSLDALRSRLFVEALWREYPGRQIY